METKEGTPRRSALSEAISWELLVAERMAEEKPDWVIQIGSENKFSVLYFSYILSRLDSKVHSIINVVSETAEKTAKKNIHCLEGNPLDLYLLDEIKRMIEPQDRVMVLLGDGLHQQAVVEIQTYASLVTEGSSLIVGEKIASLVKEVLAFRAEWTIENEQLYRRASSSEMEKAPHPLYTDGVGALDHSEATSEERSEALTT